MRRFLYCFILASGLIAFYPSYCSASDIYAKFPLKELVKTEQAPVKVARLDDGTLLADFGKAAFGQLTLKVRTPGETTVRIGLGEAMKDGRIDRNPGGTVRYAEYLVKLPAGEGVYPLELRPDPRNTRKTPTNAGTKPILMPEEIGEVYPFRYVEIEGLASEGECAFVRTAVNYPFDETASGFECPDSVLNAVWDLCKYSIKATSFCGCYVDGDRERIPYEADALINQLAHYCVDSEYAMARRSAEFLFEHPTWPTEWQLQCVLIAWYDYLYTGDTALIAKHYDLLRAKTLLALRESNALISTTTGKMTPEFYKSLNYTGKDPVKDIVDWPRSGNFGIGKKEAGEADGYVLKDFNTVVNAYHYEALVLMGRIARALGKKSDAAEFESRATEVLDAVNSLLFDETAGCYRDGLMLEGGETVPVDHRSLHANMFPLAFGMVPSQRRATVLEFIRSRGMGCSVYGSQFLLDALYDAGDADYALSLLASTSRRSWYNMIRLGSTVTLEAWDPVYKKNLDWNHAWGAAPADIIPRRLVGVEPLEPGFKSMRIKPQMGSLPWFKATVPTIRGGVRVEAAASSEAMDLTVDIPDGIRTEVWMRIPSGASVGAGPLSLSVDGKRPVRICRSRRCKVVDGFVVFSLRPGRHDCVLSAK